MHMKQLWVFLHMYIYIRRKDQKRKSNEKTPPTKYAVVVFFQFLLRSLTILSISQTFLE